MNNRDNQNQDAATPEQLRAALSRLDARQIQVPPKVDDAILRTAREHLAGAQIVESANQLPASEAGSLCSSDGKKGGVRGWFAELQAGLLEFFAIRRWAAFSAVAVTIVAVGVLVWLGGHPRSAARPEDLNGDGVVDMLDAFALARELQHDPASHPQLDLDGDGKVDERDVQALAARAVRLEQGGRS